MHLYAIALAVVALDQLTKLYIQRTLTLGEGIVIIPGFFQISYVLNPGAAFGFLAGSHPAFRNPFFIGVSILAIFLIVYYSRRAKEKGPLFVMGLGFILGGAVGNLIDRLRIGMVVDFLDFYLGSYHWPTFNVADATITTGVFLMLLDLLGEWKKQA